MRANEVSQLNKEDLRLTENLVIVQKGKNSKRRLVLINDTISNELQEFIFSIEPKQKELFINSKGNRMQHWTLNKLLKKIILRTDFGKEFTTEELKKSEYIVYGTALQRIYLKNGMALEQVQIFLGHSHIESTEIYTHVTQNQINNMK